MTYPVDRSNPPPNTRTPGKLLSLQERRRLWHLAAIVGENIRRLTPDPSLIRFAEPEPEDLPDGYESEMDE
jgi:hypothetical protein